MLLIIFSGLIASLTLVSGNCDVGNSEGKYFDWYKVGAGVMTQILKQATVNTAAWLIFHLWFH